MNRRDYKSLRNENIIENSLVYRNEKCNEWRYFYSWNNVCNINGIIYIGRNVLYYFLGGGKFSYG